MKTFLYRTIFLVGILLQLSLVAAAQSVSNVTITPTGPFCTAGPTITVKFDFTGFSTSGRYYRIEVLNSSNSVVQTPVGNPSNALFNFEFLPSAYQSTTSGSVTNAEKQITLSSALSSGNYTIKVTVGRGLTTRNASSSSFALTPITAFSVTGGGGYCVGGSGVTIGLSDSETGVNYQLKDGSANNVGAPVAGTGEAISFGTQTTAGTYTVVASNANCGPVTMSGSATVVIGTSSNVQVSIVGLASSYCQKDPAVTLAGSPAGGSFSVDGSPTTTFNPGSLDLGPHTVEYSYLDPESFCTVKANQTVNIVGEQFTQQATLGTSALCAAQQFSLSFNINCPAGMTFRAELSDKDGNFDAPTDLGAVTPGITNFVTLPTVLASSAVYKVRVVTTNPTLISVAPTNLNITGLSVALYPAAQAPVCLNGPLTITFNTVNNCPFPSGNVFTVQLSNASGNFDNPVVLGTANPGQTTFPASALAGLSAGTGYRIRVLSTIPEATSFPSAPFELKNPVLTVTPGVSGAPVCPAGTIGVNFSLPTSGCPFPGDNVFTAQLSNASGSFASPVDLGPVAPGTTSLAIPLGTPAGSGYRVRIVSSNPALTSSSSSPFTVKAPAFSGAPTVTGVPVCRGNTVTMTFAVGCSFPGSNVFTAQLSSSSGTFTSPVSLGTVVPGANTLTIPANAVAGTSYRIRVVSSSPALTSSNSATFRINACTSRLSAELADGASLDVVPNPPTGNRIRCRVSGLDNPQFSLYTTSGRSLTLKAQPGEEANEYQLEPAQTLRPGIYVLQASEGKTRVSKRVLIVE
jgi:hypothetical protein